MLPIRPNHINSMDIMLIGMLPIRPTHANQTDTSVSEHTSHLCIVDMMNIDYVGLAWALRASPEASTNTISVTPLHNKLLSAPSSREPADNTVV